MHPKVKAGKQTSSNKELQISMSQKYEYHKDLNVTNMHCYAFNASQSHSRERQTSSNEELQISMSQPSTMKSKYGKKNHLLLALQFTYLYTESDLCHEFVINLFVQHFLHTKMHCQLLQELFWSWYPTIYPTTATLAIFTQPNVTILTLGTLRYHSEYTHLPGGNFSHCYIYTFHLL